MAPTDYRFKTPLLGSDPKLKGGSKGGSNSSDDAHSYIWVGVILHVDIETMVCSIKLENGSGSQWHDVALPAPGGSGPRSWSGNIPEIGSRVLLGWSKFSTRTYKPHILGFVTVGVFPAREFEPFSSVDPDDAEAALSIFPDLEDAPGVNLGVTRLKLRKVYSGDFLASSSSGSDIVADRDITLTNRSGVEFKLRDSDQTVVTQTMNMYENNAAGYYRRGLIVRNAFNILPDLFGRDFDIPRYDTQPEADAAEYTRDNYFGYGISKTVERHSAAYDKLLSFGLIKEDGSLNFPVDPNEYGYAGYPYSVLPDGQRVSHVVQGDNSVDFTSTDICYTEDRIELKHCSDGVMSVTEMGDGIQIDKTNEACFIEDVKGTVVGNDPYSDAGRPLYKQILKMRVFDNPNQRSPSNGPILEPVDMVQFSEEADTMALARLFRINSPTNSNKYAFGISKEGRVFCHIPKSKSGTHEDVGKSVDLSVEGLIKAVVGRNNNTGASADISLAGGLILSIGRLLNGSSVDLSLGGKIKTKYTGNDESGLARETTVGGSESHSVSASSMDMIGGSKVLSVGGSYSVESTSISLNSGVGGYKTKVAGDFNSTILGRTTAQYGLLGDVTKAVAWTEKVIAGIDSKTILAGGNSVTVVAGTMSNTVTAGTMSNTLAAGNLSGPLGAGNFSATVGAGNLSLATGAGAVTISGLTTNVMGTTMASIQGAITKVGMAVVGSIVAGVPGPPSPHLCYITGLPSLGVPTTLVG